MNLRKTISIVLLLCLLVLSASCVSKSTYEATKSELLATQTELQTMQAELRTNQEQLEHTQAELTTAKTKIQELEEQLNLYKELGISVYSGIQPNYVKALRIPIKLSNNSTATNPTFQQLTTFLRQDKTDQKDYTALLFSCGNYAEEVHNNAESAGIKAAFVVVEFTDGSTPHALNAFITKDKGLVFVDCTSSHSGLNPLLSCSILGQCEPKLSNYDKIAYVVKGKELGLISLDMTTSLEYSFYEEYESKLEQYEIEVKEYNNLYDKCGGYDTPGQCEQLPYIYAQLDQLSAQLGETSWESPGVVASIEIYW